MGASSEHNEKEDELMNVPHFQITPQMIKGKFRIFLLMFIDLVCVLVACQVFLSRVPQVMYYRMQVTANLAAMAAIVFAVRLLLGVYNQMWRYANAFVYLRIVLSDLVAGVLYLLLDRTGLFAVPIPVANAVAGIGTGLLATLSSRFIYQAMRRNPLAFRRFFHREEQMERPVINVAIVGAGELGAILAEELRLKKGVNYQPYCFFDNDPRKIGSMVSGIPVFGPDAKAREIIKTLPIHEVIIALPNADGQSQREVFDTFIKTGCKVKIYDYPLDDPTPKDGKRTIREINIEDLLERPPVHFDPEETKRYYMDKVVLITGAGGSIGSELVRQIARTAPKRMVLLDVYENGVYDVQQELKHLYDGQFPVDVVIATICDRKTIMEVFERFRPDVVFHAAAHKHVPLMENNCAEAVLNNVFGTLNVVDAAERAEVKRFVMISTDKAVNPTNIMGATKRMCEMIIQSRKDSKTDFVAVRFGNVLGSNGSVVPLFKRQIAEGGPITLTDKRIIRYFMTIPEAVQLVLRTGLRGEKAKIYVLDMGKPVSILEMAENMIALSGLQPYRDIDIVEIGLRPGEKLYEELLIQQDSITKTEDDRIYIDTENPFTRTSVQQTLDTLLSSVQADNGVEAVRAAMRCAVPTYKAPEEVNVHADEAKEMREFVGKK